MADLLGTVVGVVSLGLQVCSGITKYLDGIKGHKDEIASASRLCQSLQGAVDQIRAMRNNIATASGGHDTAIEQAMMAANAELAVLRAFVDEVRLKDDPSKSISEWIKDRTNRVTYPFRRGHLDRLESQLSEANKALQSALQVAQLAISIETGNAIRSVGNEVSAYRTGLKTKLDDLRHVSIDGNRAVGKLSDGFSQLNLSLETYVPQAQQHMEASSAQLTRVESRIEEVFSALVSSDSQIVLRRVLTKPDALRLACREANINHQSSSSLNSSQTARQDMLSINSMFGCRCTPRRMRTRTKQGFRSAFVTTESFVERVHAPDCPLAGITSQKSWSVGISTKVFRTLLSIAITVSMASTSGAGGCSICPSFRVFFICNQSPAFRVIKTIQWSAGLKDESFSLVLQKGIQALQWMFKSGKASPLEIDIYWGNLLHAACNGAGVDSQFELWKLRPLQAFLVAIGVPRDQPDSEMNRLPFQTLFNWTAFHLQGGAYLRKSYIPSYNHTGFASMALDYQFLMPDDTSVIYESDYTSLRTSTINPVNIKYYHEVAHALPDTTEWYGNALHTAIMQKDQVKLVEILKKDTALASLWENDSFGYASLQLLASWSTGIELLLLYCGPQILRVDNCKGTSMLSYALYGSKEVCSVSWPARCARTCACAHNVVMLLEAGCLIELDSRLMDCVVEASMRCQEVVIGHIKKRREELAYLALHRLSPMEIKVLGVSEDTILDIQTEEVVRALKRRNVQVPQWLQTQAESDNRRELWSLYHLISAARTNMDTRHLLNIVHSHGFGGIDEPDTAGRTPLMVAAEPLTFLNLVKMGADPTRQVPGSVVGFTATHSVFWNLGLLDMKREYFRMIVEVKEDIQLTHIFPSGDECICECATNGCHPYSMLCRSISRLASRHNQWRPRLDRLSKLVAPVLDGHWDVPEDFKLIAARMATFESLSIHHTCCECRGTVCRGESRDIGDEDIEEFLEEDSRAIEILHELLPEFEAKLAEMSCSFAEFMETYWKDRMVQVLEELNEPQPMTAHNLREIRHLGVNLQVEDNNDDETEPEYGSLEYYIAELDKIMEEVDV